MQNAIITGGAAGIGRGIAVRLAQEGYKVSLIDKDKDAGQKTRDEINTQIGPAHFFECDVTNLTKLSKLIHSISKDLGTISVFVNTAGGVGDICFPDVETEIWSTTIDLNLKTVMQGIQSSMKEMKNGGDIINISSFAGVGSQPHDSPKYAASKAAIIRLTTSISDTLIQHDIKINTICPGWVDTPASRKTRENMDSREIPEKILSPDDIAEQVMGFINDNKTGRVVVWKEDEQPYDLD
ncbi:SDR family oxidoreductase [Oceanobacillus neutriphilus]|uniref:Beta-ketoacyl-ACP reductase n=1 Tax=Oceanobacillus neutriphilus TaxID=531815 RepID=A0ABQ2NUM5_9BACI|nr:SDR family oxidoreductase [Oceanobacillus neutriphilus]GGP10939.1 beta-ketoacyl-ACP reductase [Oceanobacillus neutriphilus]